MKPKTFPKKLNLNKKTISNLKSDEMVQIKGGTSIKVCTIITCGGLSVCLACDTADISFCYC